MVRFIYAIRCPNIFTVLRDVEHIAIYCIPKVDLMGNKKCLQNEDWSKMNRWRGLSQRKRNDLYYWMTTIGPVTRP